MLNRDPYDGMYTVYCIPWVVPLPSNSGKLRFMGFPTENVIMLVVTITGKGDNPMYTVYRVIQSLTITII